MQTPLTVYFAPLRCALAVRIAAYEAGADVRFVPVDPRTKRTPDGRDYYSLHPLGLVPLLECEQGRLSENSAILQHLAELFPAARLMPVDPFQRARLREWLSFVATEIHKTVYNPLLARDTSEDTKRYARALAKPRFDFLAAELRGQRHLVGDFSIADAYAFAVLTWSSVIPALDLKQWQPIADYYARLSERPSVARAFAEERDLYQQEIGR